MFRLRSTIKKADGSQILPFIAELLLNGGSMVQFRSAQPGYMAHAKEISQDGLEFIVTMDFEQEEQYNACIAAEEADPEQAARLASFNQFLETNGVIIVRETSII